MDRKRACFSVADIESKLSDVMKDPRLYAHVRQVHDTSLHAIYETAQKRTKRKRKREVLASAERTELPELSALKEQLEGIKLESWPLTQNAALFIRGPKHTDINTLAEVKRAPDGASAPKRGALLTITVYNRVSWSWNFVARSSQHAVLSSQTLGDLYEVIPCTSNEMPQEQYDNGVFAGYELAEDDALPTSSGAVMVIEDTAYGDGMSEPDYADKLIAYATSPPKNGSKMHDTTFESLSLSLHKPYWLLHQGNCEHFIVIDEIRLLHPDDLPSGYPLTLQITPPLLDMCRGCSKVPAVFSIVGDIRLGESPSLLCAPCWRHMGLPKGAGAQDVTVTPLPKHELGW
ncbi:snRNA-activating protein of 50kDa MW C terminal-domain-containing protein [Amylostereum chailletii]|nr:snRNA-activating protein of 50kDa MW C terminal-domain-containing protein [Amylostereum chailletii]